MFHRLRTLFKEWAAFIRSFDRWIFTLLVAIVLTRCMPSLVIPQLGLALTSFEAAAHYGIFLSLSMISQFVCILSQPRVVQWLGEKRLLIVAIATLVGTWFLLAAGIQHQWIWLFYIFSLLNPGSGAMMDLTLHYEMRVRLEKKKVQVKGDSFLQLVTTVGLSLGFLLSFTTDILIWILVNVAGGLIVTITTIGKRLSKTTHKQSKESGIPLLTDPSIWVGGISAFGTLVTYYIFLNILPFIFDEKAGLLLFIATLAAGILQFPINWIIDDRRGGSAWTTVAIFSSIQLFCLGALLFMEGTGWLTVILAIIAPVAGKVVHQIVNPLTFKVAKESVKRRSHIICQASWSLAGIVGGSVVTTISHNGIALHPAFLVPAIFAFATLLLSRRHYQLPK